MNCCNFVWKTSIKLYYIVNSSSIRCRLFNAQYVVFVFSFLGFTTYNRNITHFLVYLLFNRNVSFRWDNSSLFKDYKLNYSIFAVQWIKWSKIVRFCNESTKLAGTFYGRGRGTFYSTNSFICFTEVFLQIARTTLQQCTHEFLHDKGNKSMENLNRS